MSHTLVSRLMHWATEQPDAMYMTQPLEETKVQTFTWEQTFTQVKQFSAYLLQLDLPPQSKIAIIGENSAHWIIADLAIMMAGHVSVPLFPSLDAKTAAYVFDHSEVKAAFIGKMTSNLESWQSLKTVVEQFSLHTITTPMAPTDAKGTIWVQVLATTTPLANNSISLPNEEDLATIIYTSGSTGLPKGIMHCARSMLSVQSAFAMTKNDRLISYLPLAHAAERALIETCSLVFGCPIYFSHNQETFLQDMQRAQPTVFFSVPRLWLKFYKNVRAQLPEEHWSLLCAGKLPEAGKQAIISSLGLAQTRIAITGSAPTPEEVINFFLNLDLELLDCYGMSENFANSHVTRAGQIRVGYVGSPNDGVNVKLSDDGEILVQSPGQMMGYYKQEDKTKADMTAEGYFKTGDRGEIDELNRLKITGRAKDIFKTSKGKYVAPAPIERQLATNTLFGSVCVMGDGYPNPFAVATLNLEMGLDATHLSTADKEQIEQQVNAILNTVNETLPPYERLAFLTITSDQWTPQNGLLTPTLKIKRPDIESRYLPLAETWFGFGKNCHWHYS